MSHNHRRAVIRGMLAYERSLLMRAGHPYMEAHGMARSLSDDDLLVRAAVKSDRDLLRLRGIGPGALAWLRSEWAAPSPSEHPAVTGNQS